MVFIRHPRFLSDTRSSSRTIFPHLVGLGGLVCINNLQGGEVPNPGPCRTHAGISVGAWQETSKNKARGNQRNVWSLVGFDDWFVFDERGADGVSKSKEAARIVCACRCWPAGEAADGRLAEVNGAP